MKCPGCNFVCSELRDLCPSCLIDLRPCKKAAGLPITNDAVSYEELLSRAKGPSPQRDKESKGFFNSLLSGLVSSAKESSASQFSTKEESRASISPIPSSDNFAAPDTTHPATPVTQQATELLETEHQFPTISCAAGGSPQLFEWVVPTSVRVHESNLPVSEEGPSAQQTEALASIHPEECALTTDIHEIGDGTLQEIIEDVAGAEIELAIDTTSINHFEASEPAERTEELLTEQIPIRIEPFAFSPLPWDGDIDGAELAFGDAFLDINSFTASETLNTDHLFVHSSIDTEQIALQFALATDEMEGKLRNRSVEPSVFSEERTIHSETLDSALHEVETFIEKVDTPAPLKDFIQESLAEVVHSRLPASEKPQKFVVRRFCSCVVDLLISGVLAITIASLLDRGGLAALLADLSIDGVKPHHTTWILVSACGVPLFYSLYALLTLSVLDATCGERVFGLGVRVQNGRPLRGRHIIVRAFSTPLSLVIGGSLPLLFGRRSLADALSATEIY